ncbi:MAG: hypothetical protein LBK25_08030 [Treponema sp.]|jgi:hypothetical protein|nr:hypothetical protein [Treponema sp.]
MFIINKQSYWRLYFNKLRRKQYVYYPPPQKIFIFGSSSTGKRLLPIIEKRYSVIGFLDNAKNRWNEKVDGYTIYPPSHINNEKYDSIIIAATTGYEPVTEQLVAMGVDRGKINTEYVVVPVKSRITFLEKLGEIFTEKRIDGCVAEGGVFQGEFAKEINRVFPTKKLYLFDTFSGFDKRDIDTEQQNQYSEFGESHLSNTSEELVMGKMKFPEMCIIKKGYFPETTAGVSEKFCFVNLDFDLYQPILAGIEYFYPRMVKGGVILIHDYFSEGYKGVKEAVKEFDRKNGINVFPIGDGISIGIYC